MTDTPIGNGGHTPGPWRAVWEDYRYIIMYDVPVGEAALAVTAGSQPKNAANARLIAAAPDLLLAGLAVWNNLLNGDIEATTGQAAKALEQLHAAIAKASPIEKEQRI